MLKENLLEPNKLSLAETVLLSLTSDETAKHLLNDQSNGKRNRSAWKGGGNIIGHFSDSDSFQTNSQLRNKESLNSSTSNDAESSKKRTKKETDVVPDPVLASECRFVVNVSSMEGKFYRRKLATHPHTNMAKAALNMMTRTSASDYQKDNIYMTAVDTG